MPKLYADRDVVAMRDYYLRHLDHMTSEGLHGKGDIAAELAHRDMLIDQLESRLAFAKAVADSAMTGTQNCRERLAKVEACIAAAIARIKGEWDNQALEAYGPLFADALGDVERILENSDE